MTEDSLSLIIDSASVSHNIVSILNLLKFQGVYYLYIFFFLSFDIFQICMILRVIVLPQSLNISPFLLVMKRPIIIGSLLRRMKETKEMLELFGKHGITCDIEKMKTLMSLTIE